MRDTDPTDADAPTALDLPQAELPERTARYFALCEEKLGFVPNVLQPTPSTWTSSTPSRPCMTT
jgi:hypothetical protein